MIVNNVELKVECHDLAAVRSRAVDAGASDHGCFHQVDTFFKTGSGRLKLRRESTGAALISYNRADEAAPRMSAYELVQVSDPEAIERVLSHVLPIRIVVRKRRCLLILNGTRLHLDRVEQLGDFVELETVVSNRSIGAARREAASVIRLLGLGDLPPQGQAYVDLLEATLDTHEDGRGEADGQIKARGR
jgi:adenylate cyclase class IV